MFEYKCKVEKVVDGDTVDLEIDLGFKISIRERVRLYGVNTPEKRGKEKEAGLAATGYTKWWLNDDRGPFLVRTLKDKRGKFGRMLAIIYREDDKLDKDKYIDGLETYGAYVGNSLNEDLIKEGHAKEYYGGKR
jgi:micrococcal nuclease